MRNLLTLVTLGALAGSAVAQPAPDPTPAPVPAPTPEPTPPPPTPPPTPTTPHDLPPTEPVIPKPAPASPAPELPAAKKLAVGTHGLWQPGMLAQGWFQLEESDGHTTLSTFRLRRAELSVKGEILPKRVAYQVMFDPAKVRETQKVTVAGPPDAMGNPTTVAINNPTSAISALQDFYITGLSKWVDVSLGQFKIPVSWEGYNSSAKLILPERALVSGKFGDKRDIGMRFAKTFPKWGYSAGIFNGPGQNTFDNNNQKDLTLRLEAYPVKGLTIAGVTYDSAGYRTRAGTKDRWEADVRYDHGPYLVQAEYIRARDVFKDDADAITAQGFYVAAAYTIKHPALHGDLQPVIRLGFVDSNVDVDVPATGEDEVRHYDLGLNYYLQAHEMKLQASFQRQDFADKPDVNQLIVAAQVSY
jgi:hypothetical protein